MGSGIKAGMRDAMECGIKLKWEAECSWHGKWNESWNGRRNASCIEAVMGDGMQLEW